MTYLGSVILSAAINLGMIYVVSWVIDVDFLTVSIGYLIGWTIMYDARVIRQIALESKR